MMDEARTLGEVLTMQAIRVPDQSAIVISDEQLTYAELLERSDRIAHALHGLGVRAGDVVAVLMPNCLDFVACLFGTVSLGATCLTINARLRPRELAYILGDAGTKVCITSDVVADRVDYAARLREAMIGQRNDPVAGASSVLPALEHLVVLGGSTSPGMLAQDEFYAFGEAVSRDEIDRARVSVEPDANAVMLYTSGTTAMPKGCKLRHSALLSASRAVSDRLRLRPGRAMWDPCPLFHLAGLCPMVAVMSTGGTFLSMTHFDADEALTMIGRERPQQAWPAYPTILQALLTNPRRTTDSLASLEAIICVGPPDTLRLAEETLGGSARIVSLYGLTECTGGVSMTELDDPPDVRFSTCGKPYDDVRVEIRDPFRTPLPAGQRGSLWIQSPRLIADYHQDAEKTAASFDENGWFDTGDLCEFDAEGRLLYHGRTKDVLKVGGENVSAVEVESYLSTHPAVQMSAVVGRPDDKYGEVPVAFVELRPGARAAADEIIAFCRDGLAGFKVPRQVRFVTEWPMSATKIQKFRLREMAAEPLATDGLLVNNWACVVF